MLGAPALPELRLARVPENLRPRFAGDRFSYMEAGPRDAPALVLLHGLGANSMHWRYQYAYLSDNFRLIGWNAPGYMLSDPFHAETPSGRDYAEAVLGLAQALGVERFHLLGNSFGSAVAQCVAGYFPERVRRMALTGTGIGQRTLSAQGRANMLVRARSIENGSYAYGSGELSQLFGPRVSQHKVELMRGVMRATNPAGLLAAVRFRSGNFCTLDLAPAMSMPVLLIQGGEDRVNRAEDNADQLIRVLPRGRMERLEGLGHLPELEDPDTVNRLLREFFSSKQD